MICLLVYHSILGRVVSNVFRYTRKMRELILQLFSYIIKVKLNIMNPHSRYKNDKVYKKNYQKWSR